MGRAIGLRADYDGETLRRLARSSKDNDQARRLLSLALIYDGARRRDAARHGGVTPHRGLLCIGAKSYAKDFASVFWPIDTRLSAGYGPIQAAKRD